jgi:uncharacterized YigZ family protein
MSSRYPVPAAAHQVEFEIKRSRFLTFAERAYGREAAEAFIRDVRSRYPDARHVCWAYIAGAPDTTVMSMSDDGEPSGTAGRPMLNALQHSGIGEIVVAVVRYFGGIKLGTGGLQRAYSDSVMQVLADLPLIERIPRQALLVCYDYPLESTIRHLLGGYDVELGEVEYGQQVTMTLQVAQDMADTFVQHLSDRCSGQVQVRCID